MLRIYYIRDPYVNLLSVSKRIAAGKYIHQNKLNSGSEECNILSNIKATYAHCLTINRLHYSNSVFHKFSKCLEIWIV